MSRTDQLAGTHLAPDPTDLARLLAGAHHNPHAILGAHEYGDRTVIRAFRPHAAEVVALVGKDRYPLHCRQTSESSRSRYRARLVQPGFAGSGTAARLRNANVWSQPSHPVTQ